MSAAEDRADFAAALAARLVTRPGEVADSGGSGPGAGLRFRRAWHLFVNAAGELAAKGGDRLTVGIGADGAVYLTGDPFRRAVRMTRAAAAALAGRLADAAGGGSEACYTREQLEEAYQFGLAQPPATAPETYPLPGAGAHEAPGMPAEVGPFADVPQLPRVRPLSGAPACSGCGVPIVRGADGIWRDAEGSERCGPGNPMCRGDDLDPFHQP